MCSNDGTDEHYLPVNVASRLVYRGAELTGFVMDSQVTQRNQFVNMSVIVSNLPSQIDVLVQHYANDKLM